MFRVARLPMAMMANCGLVRGYRKVPRPALLQWKSRIAKLAILNLYLMICHLWTKYLLIFLGLFAFCMRQVGSCTQVPAVEKQGARHAFFAITDMVGILRSEERRVG